MESGLYDNEFMGGRFYWWLGQVVDSKLWRENLTDKKTPSSKIPGWGYRYKVMIMGLHDQGADDKFKEKLYWAQVMHSVWGGGEGGSFQTPGIKQGSFVFGWFLDGNDKQLPIIMGVLGKNAVTEIKKLGVQTYEGSSAYVNDGTTFVGDSDIRTEKNGLLCKESVDNCNEEDKADKIIKDEHGKCFIVECVDPEEKSETKGIQLAIEKMQKEIAQVQKSLTDLPTAIALPIQKLDTSINDIIDKYTGDVSEKMNEIMSKVEHFSQASLTEKALGLIALAPPSQARKLGKEQQEAAARLACVFNKIRGNLFNLIGKSLRKSFYGDDQRALPPEGFYRPTPACATEDMMADVMSQTLDEIVGTFDSSVEGIVGKSNGGPLAGVKGAIGKLSNLQNLGSGVVTGALGGIGGGALSKLSGSLNFLNGFGALGGMGLDMSLAMTFVAGVKAFYDCDTKKKCSRYEVDCASGEKVLDEKINNEEISEKINKKLNDAEKDNTEEIKDLSKRIEDLNVEINKTTFEGGDTSFAAVRGLVVERAELQDKLKELLAAEADNSTELNKNAQSEILFGNELVERYGIDEEAQQDLIDQGLINTNQGVTNTIPMVGDFYFSQRRYYILQPDGSFSKTRIRPNSGKKFEKDNFISDAERFLNNSLDGYEASSFSEITQLDVLRERANEVIYNLPTNIDNFSENLNNVFEKTPDYVFNFVADRFDGRSAKNFVDWYLNDYYGSDFKLEQGKDLTYLLSNNDKKWLKENYRDLADDTLVKAYASNGEYGKLNDYMRIQINLRKNDDGKFGLDNSLGNSQTLDYKHYEKTGEIKITGTYNFDNIADLDIRLTTDQYESFLNPYDESATLNKDNEVVFEKNENNEIIQSIAKLVNRAPREYIESKIGPENINKIINKPYNWVINLD